MPLGPISSSHMAEKIGSGRFASSNSKRRDSLVARYLGTAGHDSRRSSSAWGLRATTAFQHDAMSPWRT